MIRMFGHRRAITLAGVALLSTMAAPAGQKPAAAKKQDVVITKPTREQIAMQRNALQARQATVKAALVKAREEGEAAREAFLSKQRAQLKAENARVMTEIARRGSAGERDG